MEPRESNLAAAVDTIRKSVPGAPRIGIILGSGLGEFTESLAVTASIPTTAIPHYPASTVEGHKGELVFWNRSDGTGMMAFRGRVHFYETGRIETPLFPVRVAASLGVRVLVVTNAAGGINRGFVPGDLMLITDQLNLTSEHVPFTGHVGGRTADLYDPALVTVAADIAARQGIRLHKGVYAGVKGPSYETASEVEMCYRLGADAVGMSTVLEVSLASALGIRVLGISCITNKATGTAPGKLSHAEVHDVADRVQHTFTRLVTEILDRL